MAAKIFDNDAMIRYSVELLMQKKKEVKENFQYYQLLGQFYKFYVVSRECILEIASMTASFR